MPGALTARLPSELNIIAAFSIIAILAFFLPYAFASGLKLYTESYGQMVSFFILVLPTVLAWEGVLDRDLSRPEGSSIMLCSDSALSAASRDDLSGNCSSEFCGLWNDYG